MSAPSSCASLWRGDVDQDGPGDGGFDGKLSLVAEKHNGRKRLQDLNRGSGRDTQRAKPIGPVGDVARDAHHMAAVARRQRRQPTSLTKT
jgi:hypothetical protein